MARRCASAAEACASAWASSGRRSSACATAAFCSVGTPAAKPPSASESVSRKRVAGSAPSDRASSIWARSAALRASSTCPSAATFCVRARVTSMAVLTPASSCACASSSSSAASAASARRAPSVAAARVVRR
jgi:hypothetical protein